jgi:methylated-DNA-[protein]-cysteine S-methyltransferase
LVKTSLSAHVQHCVIRAPFGGLRIRTEIVDASLMITQIQYLSHLDKASQPLNELAKDAKEQIETYFDDPHFLFDLPMKTQGSTFQQRVWSTIESIPVGKTMTYGELANQIKSGPRAVGGACAANYYPLIIPCHRVLSKAGVGGFMGEANGPNLRIKQWLLRHENAIRD